MQLLNVCQCYIRTRMFFVIKIFVRIQNAFSTIFTLNNLIWATFIILMLLFFSKIIRITFMLTRHYFFALTNICKEISCAQSPIQISYFTFLIHYSCINVTKFQFLWNRDFKKEIRFWYINLYHKIFLDELSFYHEKVCKYKSISKVQI